MADWGRRVDVVTWCLLGLVTCFWAVSLGGVAALSKIYSGPSNNGKLAWWVIWFQAAAIVVAALVQHQKWYSSRTMVMGLFCALTAVMMFQTHFANIQRQTASTNVAYSDMLSQQNQALQSAQTSLPALPPQLAGTLNGIISGLSSGVSQAATAAASGGAGRKLLDTGRKLPAIAADIQLTMRTLAAGSEGAGRKLLDTGRKLLATAANLQRRADVVFVGFVFMTLLDLGLLVLFGIQHPNCKQRSPRVYISGVDHGASQQASGKERNSGSISLQVMAVPMSRQASGMSVHELRLPSSNSVTAYRMPSGGSPAKKSPADRGIPSRQMSSVPLRDSMDRYPSRQLSIPPMQPACDTACTKSQRQLSICRIHLERCDPCPAPTIPTYPYSMRQG